MVFSNVGAKFRFVGMNLSAVEVDFGAVGTRFAAVAEEFGGGETNFLNCGMKFQSVAGDGGKWPPVKWAVAGYGL